MIRIQTINILAISTKMVSPHSSTEKPSRWNERGYGSHSVFAKVTSGDSTSDRRVIMSGIASLSDETASIGDNLSRMERSGSVGGEGGSSCHIGLAAEIQLHRQSLLVDRNPF